MALQLIIMCQYWFTHCDKCTQQCKRLAIRQTGHEAQGTLLISLQIFCKLKTILKLSFLKEFRTLTLLSSNRESLSVTIDLSFFFKSSVSLLNKKLTFLFIFTVQVRGGEPTPQALLCFSFKAKDVDVELFFLN